MRRALRPATAMLLAIATLLLIPAGAWASEASTIIERCSNGESLSGFSQNGYREAIKQMPTEVSEYSDCATRIRKAELAAIGGGGPNEGSASVAPIPLTPAERREVANAHRHGSAPVQVGNKPVKPGVVQANIASVTSKLPTSLQALLAVLLAGALALAARRGYRRVRVRNHG